MKLKITLSGVIILLSNFIFSQGWYVEKPSVTEGKRIFKTVDGGLVIGSSHGVIKFDERGNEFWTHTKHSKHPTTDIWINNTHDNGFICIESAATQDSIILYKINSAGNLLWDRVYTNFQYCRAFDVIEYANNKFAVTGIFIQSGISSEILTFDSLGNFVTSKNFFPGGYSTPNGTNNYLGGSTITNIEKTKNGEFIANGSFDLPKGDRLIKLDQNLDTIWTKTVLDQYLGEISINDSFYISTIKFGSNTGRIIYYSTLGDSLFESPKLIQNSIIWEYQGLNNNKLLVSEVENWTDFYLYKMDRNSNVIWQNNFDIFGYDSIFPRDILVDNNEIFITGHVLKPDGLTRDLFLLKVDSNGNMFPSQINATVYLDFNNNCLRDTNDILLSNIYAKCTDRNITRYLVTNSNGEFKARVDSGISEIKIETANHHYYDINCINNPFSLTINSDTIVDIDIPIKPKSICPSPSVSIVANSPFKACRTTYYYINYCNYGTAPIDSVYIEVEFDSILNIDNSTIPYQLHSNLYYFSIGHLDISECGTFRVEVSLPCTYLMGKAICSRARIFPDSVCYDNFQKWDKSNITIEADCKSPDTLLFKITNEGPGDMDGPRGIIIVEDNVMYQNFNYQLDSGFHINSNVPANGSTWRLEAKLDTASPFNQKIAKVVEGCGNSGISMGFMNIMPLNYGNPFVDYYCDEVVSSCDPNDKRSFPYGISEENYINNEDPLNYKIRFQNTGNDTAFYVYIRDTLSDYIEVSSVILGASSHSYEFEVFGQGVLEWKFKNILLPDSNVNEPESHGFVKFSANLKPNLPNGTVIENNAAIYFDFNPPVFTNTTYHKIGELGKDYLVWLGTLDEAYNNLELNVYPNPSSDQVFVNLNGLKNGEVVQVEIFDLSGKQVLNEQYTGNTLSVPANSLNKGMYLIRVSNADKVIANGKVVKL